MPGAEIPDEPWPGDPVDGPGVGWKTALAVLTLVGILISDLLYAAMDPRISFK